MASPPVAIPPAAALTDGDGALLDVDKEPPDDVCVGLVLAIESVVERVLFELGWGADVNVEFELMEVDKLTVLEGADEVLV